MWLEDKWIGARGISMIFSSGDYGVGDGDSNPATQKCFTNSGPNVTQFIPAFPASYVIFYYPVSIDEKKKRFSSLQMSIVNSSCFTARNFSSNCWLALLPWGRPRVFLKLQCLGFSLEEDLATTWVCIQLNFRRTIWRTKKTRASVPSTFLPGSHCRPILRSSSQRSLRRSL